MKAIFISLFLLIPFTFSQSVSADDPLPDTSLVAYYPFNGNTNDESGNGNDGVVSGATLTDDRFGNSESAYLFSGYDFIDVPDDTTLDISGSISISLWYKYQGKVSDWGRLISKALDVNEAPYTCWALTLNDKDENNQDVTFTANLTSIDWSYCVSNTIFEFSEWYHICGVFDTLTQTNSIFINGGRQCLTNVSYNLLTTSDMDMQIGNDPVSLQGVVGVIDDVMIYNRRLSDLEIDSLYHVGGWPPEEPPSVVNTHQELSVYPNPTHGIVKINSDKLDENATIELYTFCGVLQMSQKPGRHESLLDMTSFAPGVYYLKTRAKNGEIGFNKIIKY